MTELPKITQEMIHMYEGARHAFNNDTSEARYHKAAAESSPGRARSRC
jgi:dienelactone hydrolase